MEELTTMGLSPLRMLIEWPPACVGSATVVEKTSPTVAVAVKMTELAMAQGASPGVCGCVRSSEVPRRRRGRGRCARVGVAVRGRL